MRDIRLAKFFKLPKDAIWLVPGLEIKRWFILIILGAVIAAVGLCILFDLRPIYTLGRLVRRIVQTLPPGILGWGLMITGAALFITGWLRANYSILDVNNDRNRHAVLEDLYKRRKLNRGPKIAAIGGGTGLSTMLKGIKNLTNNITAVVTVGDDGGSSGRLREELGVLPPGDIRSCITALADDEDLTAKLFQYRFKDAGGLSGHSFGNLFITAMCGLTGSMVNAVKESSKVLSIRGRVLPSTLDDMRLSAEMDDGSIIHGESHISESGKKIRRLFSAPDNCKPLEDVIRAVHDADLIILGPGSLYTSVIPNLLIKDIAKAVHEAKAKKIYVCNIMTQPGETDGFTVSDHIKALIQHAGYDKIIDAVLVNTELPKDLLSAYEDAGSVPVKVDREEISRMGIEIIQKNLVEDKRYEDGHSSFVRHSPSRLARVIYYWYRKGGKKKQK